MVERLAISDRFLYLERADGRCERVRLSRVTGFAREGKRNIYAVRDAADFSLCRRDDCPAELFLAKHLASSGEFRARNLFFPMVPSLLFFHVAFFLPYEAQIHPVAHWNTFRVIALIAGVVLALVLPTRTWLNGVGLHRARGIIPWLRWTVPMEEIDRFVGSRLPMNEGSDLISVDVRFTDDRRFASLVKSKTSALLRKRGTEASVAIAHLTEIHEQALQPTE